MRKLQIAVYQFKELSKEAKRKALEYFSGINVDHDWWADTYRDARDIGLEITKYEERICKGHLLCESLESIKKVLANHGTKCETYQTALRYQKEITDEIKMSGNVDTLLELDEEYVLALLEDYRIMLNKEYEYLTSEEAIIETIEANDYEFTEEGKLV